VTFNAVIFLAELFDEPVPTAGDNHATDDPLFPPDLLAATVRWVNPANGDDHDHDDHEYGDDTGPRWDDLPDAAEVPGCPNCPRLMSWQDALGRWRCGSCDSPERSRRLADRADRLRHMAAVRATVAGLAAEGGGSFPQAIADVPNGNNHIQRQSLDTALDHRIIADLMAICPRCGTAQVLPELRAMTGGACWSCHVRAVPRGKGHILPDRRS
jgi:ribosomal protein S27AE